MLVLVKRAALPLLLISAVVVASATPGLPAVTASPTPQVAAPKTSRASSMRNVDAVVGLPSQCAASGTFVNCTYGANVSANLDLSSGASQVEYTLGGAGAATPSNSGSAGRGSELNGALGNVGGTTIRIGTGAQGGGNPNTVYRDFSGGGAGSGGGGGHDGDHGGGASFLGSNGTLLVVAGGGGGAGGNYSGSGGGGGGDGSTGGGRTNQTTGGGGSSGGARGGGGGGGGGWWAGNGGDSNTFSSGDGAQGGNDAVFGSAYMQRYGNNSGGGFATVSYYRTTPTISVATPSGTVYAWQPSLTIPYSVTSSAGAPTGTMTVTDTSTNTQICSTGVNSGGCTMTAAQLTTGMHALRFDYSGDTGYAPTSTTRTFTVTADPVTTTVTATKQSDGTYQFVADATPGITDGIADGTLKLSISPSSAAFTSACADVQSPAAGEGQRNVVVSNSCTPALQPGNYTVQADFTANATSASSSASVGVSIDKYTASVRLRLDPVALDHYGATTTATVTVTAPSNALLDPNGTVVVSPTSTVGGTCTVTARTSLANHVATYTCDVAPAGGDQSYVATYQGDANYSQQSSNSVDVATTPTAPTLLITPSTTTLPVGSTLDLLTSVKAPDGSNVTEGTVTFYDGPVGPTNSVGTVDLSTQPGGGSITVTPRAGAHAYTAQYNDTAGSSNFSVVTVKTDSVFVQPLDASMTVDVAGDASGATSGGIPTTVTVTLTVPTQDALVAPIAISPAPASACARAEATKNGKRVVTATCSYVRSPGDKPSFTATYTDDLVATLSTTADTYRIPASPTSTTITTTSVDYGDEPVLSATVKPVVTGSAISGTVTFRDGSVVLCSRTVSGTSAASCSPLTPPHAGDHGVIATYVPDSTADQFSAGSVSDPVSFTVHRSRASIALSTSQTATKLTVSVTAATDAAGGPPVTGSVVFGDGVSSCGTVALVGALATCVITLPAAGTRTTLSASLAPGPDFTAGDNPTASKQYQRPVSGPCSGGFAILWSAAEALASHGTMNVDAGPLGTVRVTVGSGVGDCDAAGTLSVSAEVSLFSGTLTATNLSATVDQTSGLCLNSGSLALPGIWKTGALTVTQAVCFPLTTAGGLSAPSAGQLALTNSGGSGAPLLAIPGVTGAASMTATLGTACPGQDVGTGSCATSARTPAVTVTGRVAAASDTVPGVTVVATVQTDGGIAASVTTTALSIFGASVLLVGTVTRDGTGALAASVSATLAGDANPVPGLTLRSGATITLSGGTGSSPKLDVVGTVRVADGSPAQVDVAVSGSFTSAGEYHLALATSSPAPTWTPIDGLSFSPVLSGSLDRSGGATTFALRADGSGGAPLATWVAPGGVTLSIGSVSLGGDPTRTDLNCPYTAGLVLALNGSMTVGGLSVAASGCIALGDKSWHVGATATSSSVGGLTLSSLVLNASRRGGSTVTTVTGSATATLNVGSFSGSTTVTMSSVNGVFVIGGQLDATSLGLPSVSTYIAYASAAQAGWQTGLPKVGTNGAVDLPAGVSLFGALTLPSSVAAVLRNAHFAIASDATVTFEAVVPKGAGSISFSGEIATPSGFPLLTLPSGATIQSASVVYTAGTFGLTADGTVKGQNGTAAPVHLAVSISGNGSLSGSASVTGLNLLGRTFDLSGSVARTSAGAFSADLSAALTGQIQLGDATLSDVTVRIGTAGLAASGTLTVASASLSFAASFASTTSYSLSVAMTVHNWTPTSGVNVNAMISGSLTRTAAGYSYDLNAAPLTPGAGLITLTPVSGVSLALDSFELSNGAAVPSGCTVSAAGDTWLAVGGTLTFSLGSAGGTAAGTGCFDITHPAFSITVQVPGADLGGAGGRVTLGNMAVTVSRDASGFTADATARLNVQMPSGGQFSLVATLTFGPTGFAIGGVANLSSFLGGSAAQAYLFYANTQISVATGDPTLGTLVLKPGVTVGLKFSVGAGVSAALKNLGINIGEGSALAATANIDLTNATVQLRVALSFKQTDIFSLSNGTYLRTDSMALAMTLSPTQPSFGFVTSATLHVPSTVPGGAASDIGLTGGISIGTQPTAYLTVSNWNDALGLRGLNLKEFTLQGGITLTGLPLPSLAFSATVTGLPGGLANVIGYQQGAPMSIAVAIGETNLLFDVKIGTKDSSQVALAPLQAFGKADLLTVNYAELYLSPTGATIGDTVYPPGFSLGFQGSVAGVAVDVFAKVDPVNLSFYFRGTVGTISLGSLVIGPTTLIIDASPTKFDMEFDGHLAIGPSTTQIGPALRFGGYLKADVAIGIGTSGISAHLNFEASVFSSDYLPQSWCLDYVYYPCNYQWVDTAPLTIRANNIGFAINSSGFTVDVPNTSSSITFPWPTSPASAGERSLVSSARGVQTVDVASAGGLAPLTGRQAPAAASAPSTWQQTGSLGTGRIVAGGVALRDGSVLVAGGVSSAGQALRTAEIYNPKTGGWTQVASMHIVRITPTTVELRDGRVLVAGGGTGTGQTATAEIFDPAKGTWTSAGALSVARQSANAALLPDGSVLVAGGHVSGKPVTTVDRFDPKANSWRAAPSLPRARAAAAATTLADGRVLLAGGMGSAGPLRTVVVFDPSTNTWSTRAPMAQARFYAVATTLASGKVLVAGGSAGAERYDPVRNTWSQAGSLTGPTMLSSMVTLADGDVLVAGGLSATGSLTQVDRYHPATNHWSASTSLPTGSAGTVAALLPGGGVLVAGGLEKRSSGSAPTALADSYVYATTGSDNVPTARFRPLAAPLVTAGSSSSSDSASGWMWVVFGVGIIFLLAAFYFVMAHRRREDLISE